MGLRTAGVSKSRCGKLVSDDVRRLEHARVSGNDDAASAMRRQKIARCEAFDAGAAVERGELCGDPGLGQPALLPATPPVGYVTLDQSWGKAELDRPEHWLGGDSATSERCPKLIGLELELNMIESSTALGKEGPSQNALEGRGRGWGACGIIDAGSHALRCTAQE